MRSAVVVAAAAGAGAAAAAAPRPNIVWVMADDLGWGEPGLYPSTSDHGRISTPTLDKFGEEGIMFTNAYAGYTVCAPSRTTFFTGRHSGQFVKYGYAGTDLKPGQQDATTSADMLRSAGYTTGAFGKTAPLHQPMAQGFDAFLGQLDQAECHNMYPRNIDQGNDTLPTKSGGHSVNLTLNWKNKSRDLCMASPGDYSYTIDQFHSAGMDWLEKVAKGDKPFFLYLSFTVPHAGGWTDAGENKEQGAPVPTDGPYTNASWPDVERDHAAVITYLDGKVADLLQRLDALGVDDRTVVFFASDNGAHVEGGHKKQFFNSTGGLKGNKRSLYEGGVRSPTMARWPGTVKGGQTSDLPWAFWDALPTFAELAGATPPGGLDGISIAPTLLGTGSQQQHEYLFFTWSGPGATVGATKLEGSRLEGTKGAYAVRVGEWKGVVGHCADTSKNIPSADDVMQLYNLASDPFEKTDVASEQADKVTELRNLVLAKNLSCRCYQC